MAVEVYAAESTPYQLKHCILHELTTPVVFKDKIQSWLTKINWDVIEICHILGETTTSFKICPKRDSCSYKFPSEKVVFETDCDHIDMSFNDMIKWMQDDKTNHTVNEPPDKRLKHDEKVICPDDISTQYPRSDYWMYADYKYMCQLCTDHQDLMRCIDWSVFGFSGRDGNQSTLWIGSEGASTPCHYDTYGCNLVAQLSGSKQWSLFPPSDTEYLYPTRVPYEESSVFSSVNVNDPNLQKYPLFKNASKYQVIAHVAPNCNILIVSGTDYIS